MAYAYSVLRIHSYRSIQDEVARAVTEYHVQRHSSQVDSDEAGYGMPDSGISYLQRLLLYT